MIFMGPQGAGKGTQAKIIKGKYNIPHISTGDILRANIQNETELGKKAKELLDKGELVPDDMVNEMIKDRLMQDDCAEGFILDGYPRTLGQAKALDNFTSINFVIELHIDDELSVKRLSARRQCKKCGAIYGIDVPPKTDGVCDNDGDALYQRDDDKEEAIRNRLADYHEKTKPLLDYYKPRNIVHEVDGAKPLPQITEDIYKILD